MTIAQTNELTVRLPHALRGYACQRTLVCCQAPWRVWLTQGEVERVWWRAHKVGVPDADNDRFESWVESVGGGRALLAQPEGACVMLDETEPACVLQRIGGAAAQPLQCQSFPRSVVRLPAAARTGEDPVPSATLEAAFLIDCPTVAALVVDQPEAFEWASVNLNAWSYAPWASAPALVRWRPAETASLTALEELRSGWWDALAEALGRNGAGTPILALLGGMQRHPEDPTVGLEPTSTLEANLRLGLQGALARLPDRGVEYQGLNPELAEGLERVTGALPEPDARAAAVVACAAGVLLQHAGLHDPRPVLAAISDTADQLLVTLQVAQVLEDLGVGSRDALLDALVATSHVVRFQQRGAGVLVG